MEVGQALQVRAHEQQLLSEAKQLQPHDSTPNPVTSMKVEPHCGVEFARPGAGSKSLWVQEQEGLLPPSDHSAPAWQKLHGQRGRGLRRA
eukprot:1788023-Pyramimonas_sp.AAC.1